MQKSRLPNGIQMTDLEIVKACAKASGIEIRIAFDMPHCDCSYTERDTSDDKGALKLYWPLENDAQAMALVKKMKLQISTAHDETEWAVIGRRFDGKYDCVKMPDLNRAICECCAKMQASK